MKQNTLQTFLRQTTLIMVCLVFFGFGWISAALGPSLPELSANSSSSLGEVGALYTALFIGALVAQIAAGPLMDRIGQRPVLVGGMLTLGLGITGVVSSHAFPLLLFCGVFGGLGYGAIDVAANVLVAETYPQHSVSALNAVNLFFGIGAVAGPAAASVALILWHSALPALWLGVAFQLALVLPISRTRTRRIVHATGPVQAEGIYRVPLLWLLGALILVYVGIETALGGWITTYINRTTGAGLERAALVSSGYWLALAGGRMVAALLGTRWSTRRLLTVTLSAAALGGLFFALTTGSFWLSVASVLLLGLSFGPIFPTVLALTTSRFRQGSGKASSVVIGMGSTGATFLPWLQGVVLEGKGPEASAWFAAGCTAAMLALYGWVRLQRLD